MVDERRAERINRKGAKKQMTDYYNNIRKSLLKFCNDFIASNELENFKPFDFDSHATIDKLPENNLIGVAEYAVRNNDKTYDITCMIVVSTLADDNGNVKLNSVVGKLFGVLKPGHNLVAVSGDNGTQIGHMVVRSPVEALPVAGTDGRPFLGIAVSLGSSFLVPPG